MVVAVVIVVLVGSWGCHSGEGTQDWCRLLVEAVPCEQGVLVRLSDRVLCLEEVPPVPPGMDSLTWLRQYVYNWLTLQFLRKEAERAWGDSLPVALVRQMQSAMDALVASAYLVELHRRLEDTSAVVLDEGLPSSSIHAQWQAVTASQQWFRLRALWASQVQFTPLVSETLEYYLCDARAVSTAEFLQWCVRHQVQCLPDTPFTFALLQEWNAFLAYQVLDAIEDETFRQLHVVSRDDSVVAFCGHALLKAPPFRSETYLYHLYRDLRQYQEREQEILRRLPAFLRREQAEIHIPLNDAVQQ